MTADDGDEIVVDSSADPHDNLVYITSMCDPDASGPTCYRTWDADEETGWAVPEAGTYWVVVDKYSLANGDPANDERMFQYEISVR